MISAEFLAGGFVRVSCWSDDPVYTIVVNVENGTLAWRREDPEHTTTYARGHHVYVVSQSVAPASALVPDQTHYTVECLDGATGRSLWTRPLEEWIPADQRDQGGDTEVREDDDSLGGHPHLVYIEHSGATLLDADSGKELWHGDRSSVGGSYAGYGVAAKSDDLVSGGTHVVGTSLATRKRVWSLDTPSIAASERDTGPLSILLGDDAIHAYDVRTGRVVADAKPPQLSDKLIDEHSLIGHDQTGKSLRLYRFGEWTRPAWTLKTTASPLALVGGTVVLDGPRGLVLVDRATGAMRGEAQGASLAGDGPGNVGAPPSFGLGMLADGTVIQLDTDLEHAGST
jgi:outer membrane protein assembly factor BamB